MKVFFVFSFATREVREGTGLIGWRDSYSWDKRKSALSRRAELKKDPPKNQRGRVLRRVIREELWA